VEDGHVIVHVVNLCGQKWIVGEGDGVGLMDDCGLCLSISTGVVVCCKMCCVAAFSGLLQC
jgi:hypothetical protein